jgi:N6-L-threonylcarbamoyladenine synthase
MDNQNLVLGIETSCDETSIAVISESLEIVYEKTFSQIEIHKLYGGVVPEIASRDHLSKMQILIEDLKQNVDIKRLKAIAVTSHPGLIGSLLVGIMAAKGLAFALKIPVIPVNHLEGHFVSPFVTKEIKFPFLMLLVSGGHSQIIIAKSLGDYQLLGTTIDDATGECFDKIARMLNLPYPGGPQIEKLALNAKRFDNFHFKPCLIDSQTTSFSFSGLKTQVLYKTEELKKMQDGVLTDEQRAEIAFAAQSAITNTLIAKLKLAIKSSEFFKAEIKDLIVCGGVAANQFIKQEIAKLCLKHNLQLHTPSLKYATDNATMIARLGVEKMKYQKFEFNVEEISSIQPIATNKIFNKN